MKLFAITEGKQRNETEEMTAFYKNKTKVANDLVCLSEKRKVLREKELSLSCLGREKVFSLSLSRSFCFSCLGTSPLYLSLFGYFLSLCSLQGPLSNMDQATTGGLLHFLLTTFEDDESSTSAMRSDILEECVRAFKSTPRSSWKMGLDLRYVDRGINIFQFYFRSSLQMEWLPSFCFICGVLGFGGFLRSGSQDLSDWRKGVFEKHCAACRGGLEEERREEDTGFQIPVAVSLVSLGTEKGSSSAVLAMVCSLNPTPSSVEHSRVS